jgi:hypothetical protein
LKIGDKSYQLHPNRSLVHVVDEVADDAALQTAQAYFDSLVKACRTAIQQQRAAPLNAMSQDLYIPDQTSAGVHFNWKILYKRYDPKVQAGGFAGSIEHIDSGYHQSPWLPANKRGKCQVCNKPRITTRPTATPCSKFDVRTLRSVAISFEHLSCEMVRSA